MAIRAYLVIISLFCGVSTLGQEQWAFLKFNEEINNQKIEEVIPVNDTETGKTAVFFKVRNGLICYLLNDQQEIVNKLNFDTLPNTFDVLIGNAHDDRKYTLYYTNSSKSKHGCVTIDFQNNSFKIAEELALDFKKERFISYVEDNEAFYAISCVKNDSKLILYRFDLNGGVTTKEYDFSNEDFRTNNDLSLTLDGVLFGKHSNQTVEIINGSIPNTLETTAALTKIYINDHILTLTNNTFKKHTYIIQIDLKKQTHSFVSIENKNFDKKHAKSNSNSFLFNDLFLDVYSNPDDINFNIYHLKDNTLLKNFTIQGNDSIPFKNTPIIHEIDTQNFYRDLGKTQRFIRHVNGSTIGITLYQIDDNFVLTLGASEKIQSGEMAIVGGILGGALGAALFSAFDSYNQTKSTRIECVFDSQFNHVEGDVPKNCFDLIEDFIDKRGLKSTKLQTVFQHKDTFIWGYYNTKGNYYEFYQFMPN